MTEKFSPELMRGSLDVMILSVLAGGPKYGYLIQQSLREASRDMVSVQAGTLYPILHRLESDKFVRSRWEKTTGRKRKWYELTAAGKSRLEQQAQEWRAFAACMRKLLAGVSDATPEPA
jgi:transcriptional regulator